VVVLWAARFVRVQPGVSASRRRLGGPHQRVAQFPQSGSAPSSTRSDVLGGAAHLIDPVGQLGASSGSGPLRRRVRGAFTWARCSYARCRQMRQLPGRPIRIGESRRTTGTAARETRQP